MENAFMVLGTTPNLSKRHLKLTLQTREKLYGKDEEAKKAYEILKNSKKRIEHEITYFKNDAFSEFFTFFSAGSEIKDNKQASKLIIILLNCFSDMTDDEELLNTINSNREVAGFSLLTMKDLEKEKKDLEEECLKIIISYLNGLNDKDYVIVLNDIYDETDDSDSLKKLLSLYKKRVKAPFKNMSKQFIQEITLFTNDCKSFTNGQSLVKNIYLKANKFKETLEEIELMIDPLSDNSLLYFQMQGFIGSVVKNLYLAVEKLSIGFSVEMNKLGQSKNLTNEEAQKAVTRFAETIVLFEILLEVFTFLEDSYYEGGKTEAILESQIEAFENAIPELKATFNQLVENEAYLPQIYSQFMGVKQN